ncbi:MAG: precorrin-6y C5,15-methyltransferase (decarboxylating) subunit CbiE [Bacillota bacterium]
MASFTIVGTGTGTEDYIIPIARKTIEEAEVIIGGERNIFPWKEGSNKEFYIIKSPIVDAVKIIKENFCRKKVVVLVSGDPGFYSMLNFLSKYFSRDEMIVIPGVSSIQVAFSRLALSWHDAVFVNIHGRPLSSLDQYIYFPKIAVLTDPENQPANIIKHFKRKNRVQGKVFVCINLGYVNESIIEVNLADSTIPERAYTKEGAVVVILDE